MSIVVRNLEQNGIDIRNFEQTHITLEQAKRLGYTGAGLVHYQPHKHGEVYVNLAEFNEKYGS